MIVRTIPSVARYSRSRVRLGEQLETSGGAGETEKKRNGRRCGAGTLVGSSEGGTGGSREKWTFVVTTRVDTRLKVGGECKGCLTDTGTLKRIGISGKSRKGHFRCIYLFIAGFTQPDPICCDWVARVNCSAF